MSIFVKDKDGNRVKVAGPGMPGPSGKSAYQYAAEGGFSGTEEQFAALLGTRSNLNLLDNWYFVDPINQKGRTEYTGSGYTIDRWAQAENSSFELSDDGLAVVAVLDIYQRLENPIQYLGKTVTFSILVDGAVYHATGTIPNSMPSGYANVFGIQAGDSILDQSAVNMNQDYLWCTIKAPVGSALKAAKLELGPVQTLAHKEGDTWMLNDPPPDKALELLKCQRYMLVLPGTDSQYPGAGYAYTYSATNVVVEVSTPVPMRAMPTVSASGSWKLICAGSVYPFGASARTIFVGNYSQNTASVDIGGFTGLPVNRAGALAANNDPAAKIILDANL